MARYQHTEPTRWWRGRPVLILGRFVGGRHDATGKIALVGVRNAHLSRLGVHGKGLLRFRPSAAPCSANGTYSLLNLLGLPSQSGGPPARPGVRSCHGQHPPRSFSQMPRPTAMAARAAATNTERSSTAATRVGRRGLAVVTASVYGEVAAHLCGPRSAAYLDLPLTDRSQGDGSGVRGETPNAWCRRRARMLRSS